MFVIFHEQDTSAPLWAPPQEEAAAEAEGETHELQHQERDGAD